MTITIAINVEPRGKGRPRAGPRGVYTDSKTRAYEAILKDGAMKQYKGAPLTGPLRVRVLAYMPVPASWSAKKRIQALGNSHTSKPDVDNIGKCIDAFNGVIWVDDAQVADLHIIKRYGTKPALVIFIDVIEPVID